MSVVNTMLRELAQRQTTTDSSILPLASATPPPRLLPRGALIAIPTFAVIVGAILAWRLGTFPGADDTTAVSAPMASLSRETVSSAGQTVTTSTPSLPAALVATESAAVSIPATATTPTIADSSAAVSASTPTPTAAAPASIGWEAVDFGTLNDNVESEFAGESDMAELAAESTVQRHTETADVPVTFERTPSAEGATALLARLRQQARQAIAAGNWQEANEAIRTGTAVAPDDPELALLHVESEALRDPSIAEQTATAVLNELPHAWPVRQWLGIRWLQMQQPKRAYSVLTTLAPSISTAPDYHTVLALAAQQSGDHAAAVASYQQLSSLQPTQGRHPAGLAMSLEVLGDHTGARTAWQQALSDPQLPASLVHYGQSRLQHLPPTSSSAQVSP